MCTQKKAIKKNNSRKCKIEISNANAPTPKIPQQTEAYEYELIIMFEKRIKKNSELCMQLIYALCERRYSVVPRGWGCLRILKKQKVY